MSDPNRFAQALVAHGLPPLRACGLRKIQVNVGNLCNQACAHCHLGAGPEGREDSGDSAIQPRKPLAAIASTCQPWSPCGSARPRNTANAVDSSIASNTAATCLHRRLARDSVKKSRYRSGWSDEDPLRIYRCRHIADNSSNWLRFLALSFVPTSYHQGCSTVIEARRIASCYDAIFLESWGKFS